MSGPAHSDAPWHRGTAAGQRLIRSAIIVAGALAASPPLMAQGDPRALLVEQGTYWQSLGRADLAEESWRKLLRVDPRSAEALYGMAQVELSRGRAEVQKLNAQADLYRRKKAAEGKLLVELAEARGTQLENAALQGAGSENMVGLKMADVLKGVKVLVLSSDGAGGLNPLDLASMLRKFEVR